MGVVRRTVRISCAVSERIKKRTVNDNIESAHHLLVHVATSTVKEVSLLGTENNRTACSWISRVTCGGMEVSETESRATEETTRNVFRSDKRSQSEMVPAEEKASG